MAVESMSRKFEAEPIIKGVEAPVDHGRFFTIVNSLENDDFEKIKQQDLKWFLKLFEDKTAPGIGENKEDILNKAKQLAKQLS